ncbi:MAG TPA: DsbE family thiol:disulfide interchange protein [Hyphomicrobiaceae bacterium]|jgi:cytochrome c biogenesis protein CcmG/thiol:disulfide interchange protein DsbE|nr:DsbE family thiol:disulfide interchange protein [Hyphomicrobiaceae bacterium]
MVENLAQHDHDGPARRRPLLWPLAIFAVLALLFAFALRSGDPSRLPSALIGKRVPEINFAALDGLKDGTAPVGGFTSTELAAGKVTVVNFWASWCVPCVQEHPVLSALKQRTGTPIFGVNYKDETSQARRFLGRYGNPFAAVGVDADGRGAIEWGVYGMPETFIINGRGEIVYKHVGPITAESLETKLIPAIRAAQAH